MRVLVVGSGGREHALIRKIKESSKVDYIACCPGNGGISYDAECFDVGATDIDGVVELAKKIKADFVVVAPDDPLVLGMVDALNEAGFATFGPKANAAIIEGSKVFSKDLMEKYNIPTAEYKVFNDPADVIDYIKEKNEFPTVIKADGLALGKGVIIPETLDEAIAGVKEIMEDKIFGEGATKLIECITSGAKDKETAITVAKSVVCSSLFKAAIFGEDANWGRILCAVGYADAEFDINKVDVDLKSAKGIVSVCRNGAGIEFSEDEAAKVLSDDEIYVLINLNDGNESATAWGCDLTYDYVKINGDYRT